MSGQRSDDGAPAGAVWRRPLALFFGIAVVVIVVDQITKRWVDATFELSKPSSLAPGPVVPPTPIIDDLIRIAKTYNDGALFGSFGSSATLFAIGSLVVIGVVLWYEITRGRHGPILVTIALGLLLGGAIGNLVDRLRWGYVIDFVDMGIGNFRWYIWNVADAAISTAIVLLVVQSLFGDRLERRTAVPPGDGHGGRGEEEREVASPGPPTDAGGVATVDGSRR